MKQTRIVVVALFLALFFAASGVGFGWTVPRRSANIQIDGVLSDWKDYVPIRSGDGSAVLYLTYDPSRLYMGIEVFDSHVTVDKLTANFSQGDFVRVGLDVNQKTKGGKNGGPYVFTFSPPTEFGLPLVALEMENKKQLVFDLRDVEVAGGRSKQGYTIEVSFPAQAFGMTQFRGGQRLRINVMVANTDGKEVLITGFNGSQTWSASQEWPSLELGK